MAQNNIGGFFVNVAAQIDSHSFQKAEQSINGIQSSISKLLGFAKSAAPIIMATTAGAVETSNLKVAKAIGLSASKLDQWKTAASVAGVSAGALTSSMSQLESKMQKLKIGQVDMGLARNLGFLGIQYGDFAKMDSDQRMRTVFNKANGIQDQKLAAQLVADTLGSGAREYYDYLKLSGKSLDQQLQEAKALNFTTDETKKNAMLFNAEAKSLSAAFKSITTLVGSEIAKQLIPVTQHLKEIIEANHDLIATGITGFIDNVGQVIRGIGTAMEKINPLVTKMVAGFGGLDKVITKVGIGFTALKLTQVAGGIRNMISSISLLKTAMTGLTAGGIFLIFDDLLGYFQGKKSAIGLIIDNFDKIKEKLGIDSTIESLKNAFQNLGTSLEHLLLQFTKTDTISEALQKISESIIGFGIDALSNLVKGLGKLADVASDLLTKDWKKLKADLLDFFSINGQLGENVGNLIGAAVTGNTYEGFKDIQANTPAAMEALFNESGSTIKKFNAKPFEEYSETTQALVNAAGGPERFPSYIEQPEKTKGKIKDGIVSPDGKVTQVAPDDWVIAARNLDDLAAAFVPAGVTNNSVNAPAAYTVNQSIVVNGAKETGQAIKQQAYNGAYRALNDTISRGNQRLQQMPGLK